VPEENLHLRLYQLVTVSPRKTLPRASHSLREHAAVKNKNKTETKTKNKTKNVLFSKIDLIMK
jgi:hypothetical protein